MLEIKNIVKSFGENRVLKDVSLTLEKGSVLGLVGENGAGKSTLMNILAGVLKGDSGSVFLDGEELCFKSPREAIEKGIFFIHQELNLIEDLSVLENMFLGYFPKKHGLVDFALMQEESLEIFSQMGLEIDAWSDVSSLDQGQKQLVEIAKALRARAKIIIMDEPTSSIGPRETEIVFSIIRRLKRTGVSFIFISHKLKEIIDICDEYAVLRDGKLVKAGSTIGVSAEEIARAMIGHDISAAPSKGISRGKKSVLEIRNFTLEPHFRNISLSIAEGERVGLTGLMGDGRREIGMSLFGILPFSGKMLLEGRAVSSLSIRQAIKMGLAYVPSKRKENAVIKDMNALDNLLINGYFKKRFLIDKRKCRACFNEYKSLMRLKIENEEQGIMSLSGGNQQKLMLARWLRMKPRLIILDNPTQGVDIGAKEDIYDIILENDGMSALVLSQEAQELSRLCSRVYVLFHGEIVKCLEGDEINEKNIISYATGAREGDSNGA